MEDKTQEVVDGGNKKISKKRKMFGIMLIILGLVWATALLSIGYNQQYTTTVVVECDCQHKQQQQSLSATSEGVTIKAEGYVEYFWFNGQIYYFER